MENQKNSLAVPFAIVVAGALIAVSLYFSNTGGGSPRSNTAQNNPGTGGAVGVLNGDINVRPITLTDHVLGNPKAPVTIIEYSDTACPFCKQFHVNMHRVIDAYGKDGKLSWVYRHLPLDALHANARNEARATECAAKVGGEEKFWQYIDLLFKTTPSNDGLNPAQLPKIASDVGLDEKAFSDCLLKSDFGTDKINTDSEEAMKAGGNGTPFNIIISAKKFDVEEMKKSIMSIAERHRIPPDLFMVSNDGTKISVGGAMPYEIMEQFVKIFQALNS